MINTDFLVTHKEKLIQIYQKERFFANYGKEGALFINFTETDKVDVFFWTLDQMTERFREKVVEEFKKNMEVKNVAFLVAFDTDDTNIITYKF
jgi:hypothetical protein